MSEGAVSTYGLAEKTRRQALLISSALAGFCVSLCVRQLRPFQVQKQQAAFLRELRQRRKVMYEQLSAAPSIEIVTRVLVVDDDKGIRDLLQMALESEGYQVAAAADGATAIEFLTSAEDAWIVLLDIMMP